jgi:ABC-type bacteriocin/lantibiotic exporter with double-glycine peptidase domain
VRINNSKPEASAEEVEKVANLSGSSDFINKLDEKMEVMVGETGGMISGGEK